MSNDDPADGLFAVPPAEFVAARNQLATDLRKDGKKEAAAAVKALSKPSVTVWATNQLARNHPEEVQRFVDISDEVLEAQGAGRGDETTREKYQAKLTAQREALGPLIEQATALCTAHKIAATRTTLDRIANNLRWGAISGDARADLTRGRLTADLDPPDFSTLIGRIPIVPDDAASSTPRAAYANARARVSSTPKAPLPANDAHHDADEPPHAGAIGGRAKASAAARREVHALKERLRPQEAQLQRLRAKASALLTTQERAAEAVREAQMQLDKAHADLERAQTAHDQAVTAAKTAAEEVSAIREKLAAAESSARSDP